MAETISDDLYQRGFLKDFPAQVKQELKLSERHISLRDKEILYQSGDNPRGLYGIISGGIKLIAEDNHGKFYVYGIAQPSWWISEIPALDGIKHSQLASAVGPTQLILIPRQVLVATLNKYPELYKQVVELLCRRMRTAGALMEDAAITPLPIRLAKVLLRIHKSHDGKAAKFSQEEIAASLGVTRQSIHRILKDWQKQQWISVGYGDISVTNPQSLIDLIETTS